MKFVKIAKEIVLFQPMQSKDIVLSHPISLLSGAVIYVHQFSAERNNAADNRMSTGISVCGKHYAFYMLALNDNHGL